MYNDCNCTENQIPVKKTAYTVDVEKLLLYYCETNNIKVTTSTVCNTLCYRVLFTDCPHMFIVPSHLSLEKRACTTCNTCCGWWLRVYIPGYIDSMYHKQLHIEYAIDYIHNLIENHKAYHTTRTKEKQKAKDICNPSKLRKK